MRAALRALPRHRRRAESLMVDTVRVERLSGSVTDPVSYKPVKTYTLLYEGRAKVQAFEGSYEQTSQSGGMTVVEARSFVHVPVDAGVFLPGDRITVVTALDPLLVGTVYELQAGASKSLATAQRMPVTQVEAVS